MNTEKPVTLRNVLRDITDGALGSGKAEFRSYLSSDLKDAICTDPFMRSKKDMLDHIAGLLPPAARVLDFGCGNLPFRRVFERLSFDWVGLDFLDSIDPEYMKAHSGSIGGRVYYDGLHVPFAEASFDLVWASQSLEHVQDADVALAEIARVTRRDGYFAGSASFLEPYHARSTYLYTPYGFDLMLRKHGFVLRHVTAGTDGLTLILNRVFGFFGRAGRLASAVGGPGLLGALLVRRLREAGHTPFQIQCILLQICGTFRFVAQRGGRWTRLYVSSSRQGE